MLNIEDKIIFHRNNKNRNLKETFWLITMFLQIQKQKFVAEMYLELV